MFHIYHDILKGNKNMTSIIVSKTEESHPNFYKIKMAYGLGTSIIAIKEEDVMKQAPKEPFPILVSRDLNHPIKLPKCLAMSLCCEYSKKQHSISIDYLYDLTQISPYSFMPRGEDFIVVAGQHGFQKYFEWKNVCVVAHCNGGTLICVIDNKDTILLEDDELVEVINKLWDAGSEEEAKNIIFELFGCPKKRVALYFTFALNNLIVRSARNQILFV